jgi:hypothetical protein
MLTAQLLILEGTGGTRARGRVEGRQGTVTLIGKRKKKKKENERGFTFKTR